MSHAIDDQRQVLKESIADRKQLIAIYERNYLRYPTPDVADRLAHQRERLAADQVALAALEVTE